MRTFLFVLTTFGCLAGTPGQDPGPGSGSASMSRGLRKLLAGFPTADAHLTVTGAISGAGREVLDGAKVALHFDDQQTQELVVAIQGREPVGFLHVRWEVGEWGLVEIVWSLGMDLRPRDFFIERCRSSARKQIEGEAFRKVVLGKSEVELREMLSADDDLLTLGARLPGVAKSSEMLASTVIRSAIKTIRATRSYWGRPRELKELVRRVRQIVPSAASVERVEDLYPRATRSVLRRDLRKHGGTAMDPKTAILLVPRTAKGEGLGVLFRGDWLEGRTKERLWWHLGPKRAVVDLVTDRRVTMRRFRETRGMTLRDVKDVTTFLRFVAAEVLLVVNEKERKESGPRKAENDR